MQISTVPASQDSRTRVASAEVSNATAPPSDAIGSIWNRGF
jgi:hypothetical protein